MWTAIHHVFWNSWKVRHSFSQEQNIKFSISKEIYKESLNKQYTTQHMSK